MVGRLLPDCTSPRENYRSRTGLGTECDQLSRFRYDVWLQGVDGGHRLNRPPIQLNLNSERYPRFRHIAPVHISLSSYSQLSLPLWSVCFLLFGSVVRYSD